MLPSCKVRNKTNGQFKPYVLEGALKSGYTTSVTLSNTMCDTWPYFFFFLLGIFFACLWTELVLATQQKTVYICFTFYNKSTNAKNELLKIPKTPLILLSFWLIVLMSDKPTTYSYSLVLCVNISILIQRWSRT